MNFTDFVMAKKIIISYFNEIAAVFNHNKIEEIVVINQNYQVNDIYIGIVHKIFSSINAAFIKLGKYGKSGFIHVNDIKNLNRSRYIHHIGDILSINQLVLVQVVKEPTFNKGPRLTTNIHLYGKYLVLMPFCNAIFVSHQIYDENERMYLYSLAVLIKPSMMGLIIKPSAQGITEKGLLQDLEFLKKQWFFIEKTIIASSYPSLIYKDEDLILKIIRDLYEESIRKIIIDSEDGLRLLFYHLNKWNNSSLICDTKLQFYGKSNCILKQFLVRNTIKQSLRPKVKLVSGGYIIIESYEALTVIDVNSGSFNTSTNSQEAILRTNFYAAIEIAYQLKIRNINGVVVIDFIDMNSKRDQLQLIEHFSRLLLSDNSRPQIVQLSELGFVELTRRRRGQSLREMFGTISNSSLHLNNNIQSFSFFKFDNENSSLIDKDIRGLFFSKKFNKKKLLTYKKCHLSSNIHVRYFTFLDKSCVICLFNPKATYLIPLIFYLELINIA